jgi:integrase
LSSISKIFAEPVAASAAALRRSELVAIDMEDLTRTPEGYVLKIRRGKTDQTGKGAVVGIPTGKEGTCPVVAIETWLEESGIVNGAVFRSIDRWENIGERLSPIDVARAVQNAVKRAGASPKGFSGHSLRADLAADAPQQGPGCRVQPVGILKQKEQRPVI